jgi:hypothetical protein
VFVVKQEILSNNFNILSTKIHTSFIWPFKNEISRKWRSLNDETPELSRTALDKWPCLCVNQEA